jgi:uracil-DNA glycosylase
MSRDLMDSSWNPILGNLYQQPLLKLNEEILPNVSFYPAKEHIFRAFQMPLNKIKVVILGQDPYPSPNTAIGYAFAVNKDSKIPPSLRIIQKELFRCLSVDEQQEDTFLHKEWKTLQHWTDQGVLLLNTALTVEAGEAGSHLEYWKLFIESVIRYISEKQPCIWLLWGKKAQVFQGSICNRLSVKGYDEETIKDIPVSNFNYILEAPHPAASLYGGNTSFIGCNHFYLTNEILKVNKLIPIKW